MPFEHCVDAMHKAIRPSDDELIALSGLLTNSVAGASGNEQCAISFDQLSYHGIAVLALENGTLPKETAAQATKLRANLIAGEAFKKQALEELFSTIDAAGLNQTILFKGSALAYTVYNTPWQRPRSDSDILINKSDLEQYDRIFTELGYQSLFAVEGDYVAYQKTYTKQLSPSLYSNIDVHWRINNRQILANSLKLEGLLRDAMSLRTTCGEIKIPHIVDSVLISSLHRLGHHHKEERLIWLYDIHQLIQKFTDSDWHILVEKAKESQLAAITLDALQYCTRLFSSEIPKTHLDDLAQLADEIEPSQIFLHRDLAEWRYFLADIRSLPSWYMKVKLLQETAFPNGEYLKQQMNSNSKIWAFCLRAYRGLSRMLTS